MSNILKSLKSNIQNIIQKLNNKTKNNLWVKHIPNNENHKVISSAKITWLGIRTVVECSNANCLWNKDK